MRKLISVLIAIMLTATMLMPMALAEGGLDPVTVEGGQISGVATDVEGVTLYKGVPFGASTAGENRWKAPQPVEPWEGVKAADTWGDQVVQVPASIMNPVGGFWGDEFYFDEAYDPAISESGLNLNVYTPAASADAALPVLMYIHGGGNNHGHASEMEFYASKLAAKGIVVVTVQYRVSMYGFLTLPGLSAENEYGASGNYAVLDLIGALKWIQANIAGFGGDPANVTISGQSAGAMNVTALLRSPLAKGLFKNAIIQSGFYGLLNSDGIATYSDMKDVQAAAEPAIIAALGLPEDTSSEDLVKELRSHDWEYFRDNVSAVDGETSLYDAITNVSASYVIDGYVFTEDSVDLTVPGALDGINIIIGGTSDEMTSLFGNDQGTMALEDFDAAMKAAYGPDYVDGYVAETEMEAYRVNLRASSDGLLALYRLSAEVVSKTSDSNIYVYFFNHDLPPHANVDRDETFFGSFHSSELWYYFNSLRDVEGQRLWTDADYALADTFGTLLANFCRDGDPGEGWETCTAMNGAPFMWFIDGEAIPTTAAYPEREALNMAVKLADYGLTEAELQ